MMLLLPPDGMGVVIMEPTGPFAPGPGPSNTSVETGGCTGGHTYDRRGNVIDCGKTHDVEPADVEGDVVDW
jgi:hypothetical protein